MVWCLPGVVVRGISSILSICFLVKMVDSAGCYEGVTKCVTEVLAHASHRFRFCIVL